MDKSKLMQQMQDYLKDREPVYPDYLEAQCPCGNRLAAFPFYKRKTHVAMRYCEECGKTWEVTVKPGPSALHGHVKTHVLEWEEIV